MHIEHIADAQRGHLRDIAGIFSQLSLEFRDIDGPFHFLALTYTHRWIDGGLHQTLNHIIIEHTRRCCIGRQLHSRLALAHQLDTGQGFGLIVEIASKDIIIELQVA